MSTVWMAAIVAAQGMVANSSSPPPVVAVTPPAPPPLVRIASPVEARIVVPVRVRVMAGGQLLLDDTMRIASNFGASFSQNRSEAPATPCSANRYYGSQRHSLNVQLNLRDGLPDSTAVSVSVNWQRPSITEGCGPEGTRAVSLTESVPLAPGESKTVRGDAGLTVTLSRR